MASRQLMRRICLQRFVQMPRNPASRCSHLPAVTPSLTRIIHAQPTSMFHISHNLYNSNIINIQDTQDFQKRVLDSETPVIVDFHATWCGPCKLLGPRLEALITAKDGKVIMAKVDIDDNEEIAYKHGVRAVPTVLAIKKGQIADSFVGLKEDADLQSFVNGLIGE